MPIQVPVSVYQGYGEDLKKECADGTTVLVAYFYFDFYEISKVRYMQLLTGLLAQPSTEYTDKCPPVLQRLYATYDSGIHCGDAKAV